MLIKTGLRKGLLCELGITVLRNKDWRLITKYSPSIESSILYLEKAFEGSVYNDYSKFIEDEFLDGLYGKSFNSILCCGLGLGVAPYLVQPFCDTIDVVEIDQDCIDLIKSAGFLLPKVNITCDNILNYTPTRTYDFILLDIWQNTKGNYQTERETLVTNLTPFVNQGGTFYLPLDTWPKKKNSC